MDKFSRIQAARDLRLAKLQRGRWQVVKVNDDGRRLVVARGMTDLTADQEAARRRDVQSEQSIADGWNYVAERSPGLSGSGPGSSNSSLVGGSKRSPQLSQRPPRVDGAPGPGVSVAQADGPVESGARSATSWRNS